MAIVTADYLAGVFTNFKALFSKTLKEATWDWPEIATQMPSDTDQETYNWLGDFPRMREWKGSKIVKDLFTHNYTIQNKDYELTIGVDRNTMEDNKLGLEKVRIAGMASAAKEYFDYLVFSKLASGFTDLCYDGQALFSASHSEGNSGTQSNLTTSALAADTLKAALVNNRKLKNDQGIPLNIKLDKLCVPVDLEDTALELTTSQILIVTGLASTSAASTSPNVNILSKKGLTVLSNALFSDTNDWFVISTKGVMKPIMLQIRKPISFIALDQPTTENAFWKKQFNYSVEARAGVGYGLWHYSYGGNVT